MGLTDRLFPKGLPFQSRRNITLPWSGDDFPYMNFGGRLYSLLNQTYHGDDREMAEDVGGSVSYMGNSIVFACMAKRMKLFSEARPRYRRLTKGKPGDIWGDSSLDILNHPWPGAATGDLLTLAIADADIYGNFYAIRRKGIIHRLNPLWVSIVLDDADAIDARVLGYIYYPGGEYSGEEPEALTRDEVAHFKPYPDPTARFRGMSWLTPIVREVMADNSTTDHKLQFFRNGATPNMIVKRGVPAAGESFVEWVEKMRKSSEGTKNAYKTFYMSQGADATVVGKDFQQIELRATQGAGEVRIVIASGLHPVVVGVSESLQGSSLNSGNFGAARRLVADTFLRPDWRNFFSSMETLVPPPAGSQLWYDADDIAFLREDAKDAAEIEHVKAQTIASHVDKGFTRDSAVSATAAQDITLLKPDPDWVSVQVQTAKAQAAVVPAANGTAPTNGNGKMPMVPEPKRDDAFLLQFLDLVERRARQEPPVITINPAPVTVYTPEQPVNVTFERGAFEPTITVAPAEVNVTVDPTPVEVHNEPAAVNVTVEPTPVSITNEIPAQRAVTKTIKRDKRGEITAIVETPEE